MKRKQGLETKTGAFISKYCTKKRLVMCC